MSLCNPIPIPNSGRENIRSGFIPELSAVDPKAMPLPYFELLELRWHLSRIMAMQRAAVDEDDDVHSDSETPQVHFE
ncbi:hypothetical protein PDE_01879 [Penicillium oxalicum 114-2]|uniref:Uncharacterized protein n=1 Tax=Penicillium oxalicum (strain 114-2 / CGMCC 5302) TaxID=933388 RepID=S7Z9P8_PENO1|nr:hypothetical protein PDE_01879 [Penicillium oxalicum 114-2]